MRMHAEEGGRRRAGAIEAVGLFGALQRDDGSRPMAAKGPVGVQDGPPTRLRPGTPCSCGCGIDHTQLLFSPHYMQLLPAPSCTASSPPGEGNTPAEPPPSRRRRPAPP